MNEHAKAQIRDLAELMREKKEAGKKFVVMLGAGASFGSDVPPTPQIMEELLDKYGRSIEGRDTKDRFDKLWKSKTAEDRALLLKPYLDKTPSFGYRKLAALIGAEYFDVVLTFNFDDLLEKALSETMRLRDVKPIIRGETDESAMEALLGKSEPRFKLFKLHGSLRSSDHFLFDSTEMLAYPDTIASLLKRITARDIIVCGYAFADICVVTSFSQQGGTVVCVDPTGAPQNLRGFLPARRSEDLIVECTFDAFFEELHRALLEAPDTGTAPRPLVNPFKFLESYEEVDRDTFKGRDPEQAEALAFIENASAELLILVGPEKAGKTSFAKAGLMAALDNRRYLKHYHRCDPDFESSLPADLARLEDMEDVPHEVSAALQTLGDVAKKRDSRGILVLDQFERVIRRFTKSEREERRALFGALSEGCNENLTLVLVMVADDATKVMGDLPDHSKSVYLEAFEPKEVGDIISELAEESGLSFDPAVIDDLVAKYEDASTQQDPNKRFTLAHVQAVCHILASSAHVDKASYDRIFQSNEAALHQAINAYDIIGFLEDFSWHEARQMRNIMKVALKESKERIAKFIQEHYTELLERSENADLTGASVG